MVNGLWIDRPSLRRAGDKESKRQTKWVDEQEERRRMAELSKTRVKTKDKKTAELGPGPEQESRRGRRSGAMRATFRGSLR